MDLLEKTIKEEMTKNFDGASFYIKWIWGEQEIRDLIKEVKESISKCGLSSSEAKGFLEYMKMVVDSESYIPREK